MSQPKHIVIFGSYNGGSIGDTAILLGLISSLQRVCAEPVSVSVLSMGEIGIQDELDALGISCQVQEIPIYKAWSDDRSRAGKLINRGWRGAKRLLGQPGLNNRKIRKAFQSADLLLVGGGNLVMDLFPRWPKMMHHVCTMATRHGIPYHLLGVGAAPIDTPVGKRELLDVLTGARSVTFRDDLSVAYCQNVLGFNNAHSGPDLAFGITPLCASTEKRHDQLMLNLAALYSPLWPEKKPETFEAYIGQSLSLVLRLCSELNIRKVVLFNSNYPLDQLAADAFSDAFSQQNSGGISLDLIPGRQKVAELITACGKAEYALVTRLHAGIISRISGAKLLAVAYQPKVKDVLSKQADMTLVAGLDELLAGSAFTPMDTSRFSPSDRGVSSYDVDRLVHTVLNTSG